MKHVMRRFILIRNEDVSGTSGTGVVAEGVQFSNGSVTLTWLSHLHSVTYFSCIDVLKNIHGHEGRTEVQWIDP